MQPLTVLSRPVLGGRGEKSEGQETGWQAGEEGGSPDAGTLDRVWCRDSGGPETCSLVAPPPHGSPLQVTSLSVAGVPRPGPVLPPLGGSRPGRPGGGAFGAGTGRRGGAGFAFKCGRPSAQTASPGGAQRGTGASPVLQPGHVPALPAPARLSRPGSSSSAGARPGAASSSPRVPGRCPSAMRARALLLAVLAALAQAREPPAAPCPARCDVSRCPSPRCPGGYVPDLCNCCLVCAASEGEPCGGPLDAPCGESLECARGVCRCRGALPVCGTDGRTYANVCALQAASRRALRLSGSPVRQLQKGACPLGKCARAGAGFSRGNGGRRGASRSATPGRRGQVALIQPALRWGN